MSTVLAAVAPLNATEEALLIDEIAEQAEQEEAEAARHGIDVNEWKEYLSDLCKDAVEVAFES